LSMAHKARSDLAMLLGQIFLLDWRSWAFGPGGAAWF
jgi:hypothetical protein